MDYDYNPLTTAQIWAICFWSLAFGIFILVAQWKVYVKAGQPGWACIIPIYNVYVLLQICGKPWWWLLLMLIPGVNIVFAIWMTNMVSKSFGHEEGFTVGLLLLGIIFWPILGFGKSRYLGPYGNPEAFRAYPEQHKFDFDNNQ